MGNNTSAPGNNRTKVSPSSNYHSQNYNPPSQNYNPPSQNYNNPPQNYNNTYQFPDNDTDVSNHMNHVHNGRMMDRQFNLPNIPFDPRSFNHINNITTDNIPNQPPTYNQPETPHIENNNQTDENKLQNSLKVFQLDKNYTEVQLKNSYRNLVLKYHPDRGGDIQKFQYITQCYDYLTEQLKLKIQDAQFYELKNQSNTFIDKQATYQNVNMDKDNFNTEKFNQIFSENRMETEENKGGYGNWMKENAYTTTDINKNSAMVGRFSNNKFNQEFSKNVSRDRMEIVEYKDPVPTPLKQNIAYSEIDDTQKSDYSSNTTTDNICFTDYRKAHTKTHMIDETVANRKEFKNMKQLENSRAQIQYQMTPEEMRKHAANEEILQYQEQERLKRIQNKDQQIGQHFNKVNQLMLSNNFIE